MPPTSAATLARVGVVIVTYASAEHVGPCLGALPLEELGAVVVVDNGSPDDTAAVVRRLALPGVALIEQRNVGFGGGCNTGVAALAASCDLVLLCNPDARIGRSDLVTLAEYLLARPSCALAAPRLQCAGEPLTSGGSLPRLATELRPLLPAAAGAALPRRALPSGHADSGPVGYVEGACMLLRRPCFEDVGGFDEGYFLCFEEIDLAARLQAVGRTVELCAEARAEHCSGASRAQVPFQGRPHAVRGVLRYLEKFHGQGAALRYARAARLSWWLRRRTGSMDPATYAALVSGLSVPSE